MFYRLSSFGVGSEGWSSNNLYPRELADVNGDGKADIVGFGRDSVYVALASNVPGGFDPAQIALNAFTVGAGGWSTTNEYPRELGDVNGDGKADIVGFGKEGVYVALGAADGTFARPEFIRADYGTNANGWTSNDLYPRKLSDVNGDGRADIVGFGNNYVFVSLGTSSGGFEPGLTASSEFTNAVGWASDDLYLRELGDVNGDGKADIVGFGKDGVYVALGAADGTFAPAHVALNALTINAGWTSNELYPRELGDMNGDGKADIVGFGRDGVYVALGAANGTFAQPKFIRADFGTNANGWTSKDLFPRELGDVTGDGKADIVAFGQSGIYAVSGAELLSQPVTTIGSGGDKLTLKISEHAYQGDAQYTVSVDGMQIGDILTAKASHNDGQSDIINVLGNWAPGIHDVQINFLNDFFQGTADTDRNLYVDGATYNGVEVVGAAQTLYWTGPGNFAFTDIVSPLTPG